jgi:thiamine biosynthesis protein ThiI
MRFLSLISGGIDSPVAAYLMISKGYQVDFLHFYQISVSEKIIRIVEKLTDGKSQLFVAPHSEVIKCAKKFEKKLTCVYCKITMLKTAEKLADKIGATALVMGDSLGQVASQTISNLYVEDRAVRIPVLRPLIGLDKVEIIEIARKAGTYELSILPSEPCRAVPEKPATSAKVERIDYGVDVSAVFENIEEFDLKEPV